MVSPELPPKLEKHPDKTFIGRIDRGFDFLGYRFVAEGLRLATQSKQRFVERATRLYEQGAAASRIGEYVRHWLTWVRSGGLEHVWDELLVGVMRSYDFPGLVAGVCTDVLFSGAPWGQTEIRINLKTRSDLAPRSSGKEDSRKLETFQMEPCG